MRWHGRVSKWWHSRPRHRVREVLTGPHQFWVLPLVYVVLGTLLVLRDILLREADRTTLVNVLLMTIIVASFILWLRRPVRRG